MPSAIASGYSTTKLTNYLNFCRHLEYFGNFLQDALAFFFIIALNGCDHARIQVVFQDQRTDLVQGGFNSLYLADDIDTICVFLHHADDSTQVAFDCLQSSDCAIVFHGYLKCTDTVACASLTPPQGGWGGQNILYLSGACQADKCNLYRV